MTPAAPAPPEVVLSAASSDVPIADYGLGDGGVAATRAELRFADDGDGCVTPGGVRVACRSVGVKLTFPSGRELLVAANGAVHLRDDDAGGPFPTGVELLLGDGSAVRIALSPGRRDRVRDVEVVDGERALVPWRRGRPANDAARADRWPGAKVACCGDGGELYRPRALGPLVVLDRVLVPKARAEAAPRERLVVLTEPLVQSLALMYRQHRETDAAVRRAVAAVAGVAERGAAIFPAGASLTRAEADRPRWLLQGGFELQLDLDGPLVPRLQLFAGDSPLPMVEWTLCADSAAFLTNPRDDQLEKRWHGNGTRLARAAEQLQVRDGERELPAVLQVLRRLAR